MCRIVGRVYGLRERPVTSLARSGGPALFEKEQAMKCVALTACGCQRELDMPADAEQSREIAIEFGATGQLDRALSLKRYSRIFRRLNGQDEQGRAVFVEDVSKTILLNLHGRN